MSATNSGYVIQTEPSIVQSMEKFDYPKAIAELEQLAALAEDPATGLDKLDESIARSQELIEQCREYLRKVKEKIDSIEE